MDNFMLGDALIVHPCLIQGDTSVKAYFPTDTWYDFHTGRALTGLKNNMVTLSAELNEKIPIHMRAGYIVPTLDKYTTAMTVTELMNSPMTMVVAPDANKQATGYHYFDDGENIDDKYGKSAFNIAPFGKDNKEGVEFTYSVTFTNNWDGSGTNTAGDISGFTFFNGSKYTFSYVTYISGTNELPLDAMLHYNDVEDVFTAVFSKIVSSEMNVTIKFYY
jgi:alpha-glucosidase (family GH31 glycosyl hydrolase)